jgi:hypothetical protein
MRSRFARSAGWRGNAWRAGLEAACATSGWPEIGFVLSYCRGQWRPDSSTLGPPGLGSSGNAIRTTCFQSLAWAPLIGRYKGDAAAFSWPGMNGPAHGRFRFVMQDCRRPGPPVCRGLRQPDGGTPGRRGIGFVLSCRIAGRLGLRFADPVLARAFIRLARIRPAVAMSH